MNTFFTEIGTRIFERLGLIDSELVATVSEVILFEDEDGDDDEIVTFFLRQFPSGRRFYSVHVYGAAEACKLDRKYAASVIAWTYGGPLPENAEVVRNSAVILKVFEGGGGDAK